MKNSNTLKNIVFQRCRLCPFKCIRKGGEGGVELANKVVEACEKPSAFKPLYSLNLTLKEKVEKIAKEIYGASKVNYTTAAEKAIKEVVALGGDKLPICVAKHSIRFQMILQSSVLQRILKSQ